MIMPVHLRDRQLLHTEAAAPHLSMLDSSGATETFSTGSACRSAHSLAMRRFAAMTGRNVSASASRYVWRRLGRRCAQQSTPWRADAGPAEAGDRNRDE